MAPSRPPAPGALVTEVPTQRVGWLARLRYLLANRMVRARNRRAEAALRANEPLWALMTAYARGSAVTGASYSDYLTLWEQVRAFRPREILE